MLKFEQLAFTKKYYTFGQKFILWLLYMLRNLSGILTGIIGIISFGFFQLETDVEVSEIILRTTIKFYNCRILN